MLYICRTNVSDAVAVVEVLLHPAPEQGSQRQKARTSLETGRAQWLSPGCATASLSQQHQAKTIVHACQAFWVWSGTLRYYKSIMQRYKVNSPSSAFGAGIGYDFLPSFADKHGQAPSETRLRKLRSFFELDGGTW